MESGDCINTLASYPLTCVPLGVSVQLKIILLYVISGQVSLRSSAETAIKDVNS